LKKFTAKYHSRYSKHWSMGGDNFLSRSSNCFSHRLPNNTASMLTMSSTTPANFYAMPTSHAKATYVGSSATATSSYILTSDGDNFLT
jgi:hypothetical protein